MPGQTYSRLGSLGGAAAGAPSPPPVPPAAAAASLQRGGGGSGRRTPAKGGSASAAGWTGVGCGCAARRAARAVLAALHRRQAVFLFAPLLYVAAMLLYMGSIPLDVVPRIIARPAPGSVYRSPQLYARLRADMDADNSTDALATLWRYKGGLWRPCINNATNSLPESNGYIYIEANGGLNQQRTSICNAVAIAGFLNATLVIPKFHFHSIWRDPSTFSDIYDEDHFVKRLQNDVRVVEKVPDFIMERFGHNLSNVFNFKIKAWSPIQYYKDAVLPKLIEERLIRISPFANRLSFDAPPVVQRLRCLANFEALKFSNPIATLSETLVSRMKEKSMASNGKYIAVHLRFEEDMVAFSCCVYDGGDEEKKEMNAAREIGWRGKFTKRGRVIRPGVIRMNGKCPLTPLEVGLMLRGMGFSNNTAIFLASGKIYRAEKNMVPLLQMFPLLQTKETLASAEELAPFKNFSSRMAAIDYSVCVHSDAFVTTQGGNFPHFLMGHRRYLYGGHSRTIKPDKRRLAILFDNPRIGWKSLKRHLLNMRTHSDSKGLLGDEKEVLNDYPNDQVVIISSSFHKIYQHPIFFGSRIVHGGTSTSQQGVSCASVLGLIRMMHLATPAFMVRKKGFPFLLPFTCFVSSPQRNLSIGRQTTEACIKKSKNH
uniref:O-fucosyltransferase family protein n=1 Tax=Oryza punctata TaxID=4537 RepID=A0A0E0L3E8_ORYPU